MRELIQKIDHIWNCLCRKLDKLIDASDAEKPKVLPSPVAMCLCEDVDDDGCPDQVGWYQAVCVGDLIEMHYVDSAGVDLGTVLPDGWGPCLSCKTTTTCTPSIQSFTADAPPTIVPFNTLEVENCSSCDVVATITPDNGPPFTFTIKCGVEWTPNRFDCDLVDISFAADSPECLPLIKVGLQHTGNSGCHSC